MILACVGHRRKTRKRQNVGLQALKGSSILETVKDKTKEIKN